MRELLLELRKRDIDVSVQEGHLKLNIPKDHDVSDLLPKVKEHREALIAYIHRTQMSHGQLPLKKVELKKYYPLSSAQKRLYVLYEFDKESLAYNSPSVTRLVGKLNVVKFENSIKALTMRHESLRTSFEVINGKPVQKISKYSDFDLKDQSAGDDTIQDLVKRFTRPFDLVRGPLFRVGLVKMSANENLLLIDMHHIIADAFSADILIRDFMDLYRGMELAPLEFQYKDYVEWQLHSRKRQETSVQRKFWLDQYSDVKTLEIPVDFSRAPKKNDKSNSEPFELSSIDSAKLKKIAGRGETSLFMTLFSIFNILLSKLSSQDDVIVGVPITDRQSSDMESIIGIFANTLALRNHPVPNSTFSEFLNTVKLNTLSCFENQSYPYEEILNELDIERDPTRNPLFDVLFVFQGNSSEELTIPGLTLKPIEIENPISKFDLILEAVEDDGKVLMNFKYNTRLFKAETIKCLVGYFKNIVAAVTSDPDVKISDVSILSRQEEDLLLTGFNSTACDYPGRKTIVDLFEDQVEETPHNVAVQYGETKLRYRELSDLSDRIACYLQRKHKVKVGDLVAIMLERELYLVPVIMGIMKAGAAYVPIDPLYPRERINAILKDSGARVVVSRRKYGFDAREKQTVLVDLDTEEADITDYPIAVVPREASGTDLAYVIYTSGSTGVPKGVMVEHHSVVNRIVWMQQVYNLKETDVLLQKTPVIFDVSVWELFWWSITGASLVLLPPGEEGDPRAIVSAIELHKVTAIHFVPSMLNAFLVSIHDDFDYTHISSLRWVFSSGEALKPEHVTRFRKTLYNASNIQLINMYGPTEATVEVSYYPCNLDHDEKIVPIGRPINNTQLYVMDTSMKVCPIGVRGELCISGVGLSRGYWGNKKLTAEKFVTHPYQKGKKIYKTGDLARWLPQGDLEYLGRIDNQVKIRGYRIELGEIERYLGSHPMISECVVVAREHDDNRYLIGYYVSERSLSDTELRHALEKNLPDYMIPSYFVWMDGIPLNGSGKVDRRRLPEPVIQSKGKYVPPSNPTEIRLVDIWARVLKIESNRISADSSFFSIGGYSLNALQVIYMIYQEFEYEMSLKDFFANSTIRKMAESISMNTPLDITI